MLETKKICALLLVLIVFFTGSNLWTDEVNQDIEKLENGLLPPVLIKGQPTWKLSDRMLFHRVPGVSIAVIKDFKVLWTKAYGYMDTSTYQLVDEKTLFQVASVSKTVTAAAILKKVQEGKLNLRKDVNKYLTSWTLPGNEWTQKKKVNIAHLLSHSGGITVPGFRGYAVSEAVPTFLQVLNGEPPANSSPIRVESQPGTTMKYSGGGYAILQQILIDLEKKPFPELMQETIFKPLHMNDSTFDQPLPATLHNRAASGHRPNGIPLESKWHIYPEMAPAGLWTTSGDLAKFIAEIQRAYTNQSTQFLSYDLAVKMLTPYISPSMGLGFFIFDQNGKSYFHHGGSNEGFQAFVIAHRDKGYGAVVLTNSDNGEYLYNEIIRGIAMIYNWDNYLSLPYEPISLPPGKMEKLTGKFAINSDHLLNITFENGKLYSRSTFEQKIEILPIAENKCVCTDEDVVYEWLLDPKTQQVTHLFWIAAGNKLELPAKPADYTVPGELLMAGQLPQALAAYRQLAKENPNDPMVNGQRLLQLAYFMMQQSRVNESLALLELVADISPQAIINIHKTLDTEVNMILQNPQIPDAIKLQIKEKYNAVMKKLQLPEIQ